MKLFTLLLFVYLSLFTTLGLCVVHVANQVVGPLTTVATTLENVANR